MWTLDLRDFVLCVTTWSALLAPCFHNKFQGKLTPQRNACQPSVHTLQELVENQWKLHTYTCQVTLYLTKTSEKQYSDVHDKPRLWNSRFRITLTAVDKSDTAICITTVRYVDEVIFSLIWCKILCKREPVIYRCMSQHSYQQNASVLQ